MTIVKYDDRIGTKKYNERIVAGQTPSPQEKAARKKHRHRSMRDPGIRFLGRLSRRLLPPPSRHSRFGLYPHNAGPAPRACGVGLHCSLGVVYLMYT